MKYYKDEINDDAIENDNVNNRINNNKITARKSFEYNTKLRGSMGNNNILDAEVVVPLNYLSNSWRYLNLPMINCEIELDLSCSRECIISEISIIPKYLEIKMLIYPFKKQQQYKQLVQHFK